MKHILRKILLRAAMVLGLLLPVAAMAAPSRHLLIINSYNDREPWADGMTQPIVFHLAAIEDVDCRIINLNNIAIPDKEAFLRTTDKIFADFSHDKPSYVVMVGNLAFNMRQRIQEEWGDIPMLLITKIKESVPLDRYFDRHIKSLVLDPANQLIKHRADYNFTAVLVPDNYEETIDMMTGLIPDMERIVFCSDSIYANRRVAYGIADYIQREYPNIDFEWLKASYTNADSLRNLFVEKRPNVGILMSSWYYEVSALDGDSFITSSDVKLISSSKNPIFTILEPYLKFGAVGGVFPDDGPVKEQILKVVDMMIAGKDMHEVPFYTASQSTPMANYVQLKKYRLSPERCPEGTVFALRPDTFWDKYMWHTIVGAMALLLVVTFYIYKYRIQSQRLRILKRTSNFIKNMPIPYSNVKVHISDDGTIDQFEYLRKNEAFANLISQNHEPDESFLLFPADFILPKIEEMLVTRKMAFFPYHFKKSHTYFDFILCPVGPKPTSKPPYEQEIDMFAIDITHRHRIAKELKYATRKLDITLEAAKIVPFVIDIDKRSITFDIQDHSRKLYSALDATVKRKTVSFTQLILTIHPDDRGKIADIIDGLVGGDISEFKCEYRCNSSLKSEPKEGDYNQWAEVLGVRVDADQFNTSHIVVGSMQYITKRKQREADMAAALVRANESDRMKSAFLANMSHEIRTPLNAIVGFSNVIAATEDPKERMEFCDIINRNNEQLLALINDVLDLSKIEANMIDINPDSCDVNKLLLAVKQTNASKIPAGVSFNVIRGQEDCTAVLDSIRITQVFNNLVSNACKFTTQGSINIGYERIEDEDGEYLNFFVKDSGRGISEADQERVFDRFYKTDTFVAGTGLGLSICKSIVEKMGGKIGVHSAGEGHGSTFWFTVPLIEGATDISGKDIDDLDLADSVTTQREDPVEAKLPTLLVAEDNDSNFRLTQHLLKGSYRLLRALDGQEAVTLYRREKPDAVLMDISMPVMNGYEATAEIRKVAKTVPIIALTANAYPNDRQRIMRSGFTDYVPKPIDREALNAVLSKYLRRR